MARHPDLNRRDCGGHSRLLPTLDEARPRTGIDVFLEARRDVLHDAMNSLRVGLAFTVVEPAVQAMASSAGRSALRAVVSSSTLASSDWSFCWSGAVS